MTTYAALLPVSFAQRWPRLLAGLAFGLAGLLFAAAGFFPLIADSGDAVALALYVGLAGLAAAAAGALLGGRLADPSRCPSGWWAALRGVVIATVALVLFSPMFATVIWWRERGWTSVHGLTALVLWFGFIAAWRELAAVGAMVGWLLYRWAASAVRRAV